MKNHAIKIKYAAFWKDQNIPLQDIDSVTPVKRGVNIKYVGKAEPTFYLMRKKSQTAFLSYYSEGKEQQSTNNQVNTTS